MNIYYRTHILYDVTNNLPKECYLINTTMKLENQELKHQGHQIS